MPNCDRKVLVLDARYEPVKILTMEQGFVLLYTGRAETVVDSDRVLHGVRQGYTVPWVVRLKGSSPRYRPSVTPRLSRQNVYLRDGYRCQYCLTSPPLNQLTLDHLFPFSRGGRTTWDNVVTACKTCNHRKGARTIEEIGIKPFAFPAKPQFKPIWIFVLRYGLTPENVPVAWIGFIDFGVLQKMQQTKGMRSYSAA